MFSWIQVDRSKHGIFLSQRKMPCLLIKEYFWLNHNQGKKKTLTLAIWYKCLWWDVQSQTVCHMLNFLHSERQWHMYFFCPLKFWWFCRSCNCSLVLTNEVVEKRTRLYKDYAAFIFFQSLMLFAAYSKLVFRTKDCSSWILSCFIGLTLKTSFEFRLISLTYYTMTWVKICASNYKMNELSIK